MPLRRQIAAQVAALVRSGRCRPSDRLPGTRRLAARLGVHRHTVRAAYGELARAGLLEARPGSGYRVRPAPQRSPDDPDAVFRGLLAGTRGTALDTAGLARRLDGWLERLRRGAVALVATSEPRRRLWGRELGGALEARELEARLHQAAPADAAQLVDRHRVGLVVATLDLVEPLGSILPAAVEVRAARPPVRWEERERLRALPSGSVVLVASGCPGLRREVRELAAALRGADLAVREARSTDDPRLGRRLRTTDLALADAVLEPALRGEVPASRLLGLPALAPDFVERLAGWVEAGAALRRSKASDHPRRPERRR